MSIAELRQHQILVQDPEIDRAEYDAVMQRLRELGERVFLSDHVTPLNTVFFDYEDGDWMSLSDCDDVPALTFQQFMDLKIER